VINGVTSTLISLPAVTTWGLTFQTTTIPFSLNSASQLIIASQTLTSNGVITVAGETISLAMGGSSIVIESGSTTITKALPQPAIYTGAAPKNVLEQMLLVANCFTTFVALLLL
jgi:hypothetical protein